MAGRGGGEGGGVGYCCGPLFPAASGEFCTGWGSGAGYNTEWETLGCPASGKVAQGKRESLTPPPPSTQHLLPCSGCGKCFEQAPKREERVGSGFSFLSLPAFAARLCRPLPALLPGSQLGVSRSSVYGMFWPWFGSASATSLADLGWLLTALPLIQTRIFCPASGPAGQTYFPARAQAG